MTNHASNVEIEDVLSSIRRLVSEDGRTRLRPEDPPDEDSATLVLTPQQRVRDARDDILPTSEESAKDAGAEGGPMLLRQPPADGEGEPEAEVPDDRGADDGPLDLQALVEREVAAALVSDGDAKIGPAGTKDATEEVVSPWAADADTAGAQVSGQVEAGIMGPVDASAEQDRAEEDAGGPETAEDPAPGDADVLWLDPSREEARAPSGPFEEGPALADDVRLDDDKDGSEIDLDAGGEADEDRGSEPVVCAEPGDVAADRDLAHAAQDAAHALFAAERAGLAKSAQSLEDKISELEAMIDQADGEWEAAAQSPRREARPDLPRQPWGEAPAAAALTLDEDALRDIVADIVRQELQGVLGERITRNVRKLVRREVQRALAGADLE